MSRWHVDQPGHGVNISSVQVFLKEPAWFERGRPGKSAKPANLVRGKIVVLEGLAGKQNGEKEKGGKERKKENEKKRKKERGKWEEGLKRDFRFCTSL